MCVPYALKIVVGWISGIRGVSLIYLYYLKISYILFRDGVCDSREQKDQERDGSEKVQSADTTSTTEQHTGTAVPAGEQVSVIQSESRTESTEIGESE